jgi:hypothetical protein
MSQASIVINVSDQDQLHSNGLSGTWIVPGKKPQEEFAILVVFPVPEIQDIGEGRSTVHWLKARPLALDILGMRSDSAAHGIGIVGNKEKWGLLLCEAEPDLPRELISAIEGEGDFLNKNMPDVKYKKDSETKATVAVNVHEPGIADRKIELSFRVQELRNEFIMECRFLVSKKEIQRAKKNLLTEDQRLVGEADRMWARPTEQQNINELHRRAAARLGREKPWAYVPEQLVACPGCGTMIKENILRCPSCAGWLDEGVEELTKMAPKLRAIKMYPDRDVDRITPPAVNTR